MATPTRLPVLLQRRKSAHAGSAEIRTNSTAAAAARAEDRKKRRGAEKANAFTCRRFRLRGLSRGGSRCVNDDGAEVVHVGVGRAGLEQVAQPREKARGIVVGEEGGRIETERSRPGDSGAVDVGAGGVGGVAAAAVGAVGVAGNGGNARHAGKLARQRQRVFLVR